MKYLAAVGLFSVILCAALLYRTESVMLGANGKPCLIEHRNLAGQLHGLQTTFYVDGSVQSEIMFQFDAPIEIKQYDEQGRLFRHVVEGKDFGMSETK